MKHPWQRWEVWVVGVALLHSAGSRRILNRERTEPIATQQCLDVVAKVTLRKRFTEDFIAGVCAEVTSSSSKCEFFSEALSLASSYPSFSAPHFCLDIEQAEICSDHMDKLLMSQPVADLAYGECLRGRQGENHAYCKRFREMLAFAVRNSDLDTLRACYVIEAQNSSNASDPTGSELPMTRIITRGGEDLSSIGFSNATETGTGANSGLVLQPQPFKDFGSGVSHPITPRTGSIIVAPKPLESAQAHLLLTAAKVEGQAHPTTEVHLHDTASTPSAGPSKSKEPPNSHRSLLPAAGNSSHPGRVEAAAALRQPSAPQAAAHPQLHVSTAAASHVTTAAATTPPATLAKPSLLASSGNSSASKQQPAAIGVNVNHSSNSSEESTNASAMLSQGPRLNASVTSLSAANASQLVSVSQAEENSTETQAGSANHSDHHQANVTSADAVAAVADKGNQSALSVHSRVQIVTRAAPLTPLSGHLHLKPKQRWANASHRSAGTAQEASGKSLSGGRQKDRRGKGDRKEVPGEYTGFLSKFVQ